MSNILSFLLFVCASAFNHAFQIIPVALSFYVLSQSDVGRLALIISFQQWMALFLSSGLRQVFALEYFHCTKEERNFLLNDILGTFFSITLLISIGFFLFPSWITSLFLLDDVSVGLLILAYAYSPLIFLNDLIVQYCSFTNRASALMRIRLINGFIMSSAMVCIAYVHPTLTLFVTMSVLNLIVPVLYGIYLYVHEHLQNYIHIRLKIWRNVWVRGLPFIPSLLASWFLSAASRWFLARYASLQEVALFALSDGVFYVFTALVLFPIGNIYLPQLLQRYTENFETAEKNNQLIMYSSMLLLSAIGIVGWYAGMPLWKWLIPPTYHEAFPLIIPRYIGAIFLMGTYFSTARYQYKKQVFLLVTSLVSTALLDCLVCRFFVPFYASYGAVWALCISYMYYFLFTLGIK